MDAIDRSLELIAAFPNGWPVFADGEARRIRAARTPYSLIYRVDEQQIVILAVAHSSGRPGYWQDDDQ
jgi:plasmid stabilization system protein ParE